MSMKYATFKSIKTNLGAAKVSLILIILSLFFVAAYAFWRWDTQPNIIRINAGLAGSFSGDTISSEGLSNKKFSHQSLEQLLARFVYKGKVNYQAWFEDEKALKQLDRYLAAVAQYSPENTPRKFENKNERLIYWVYAYNAVVIKSILNNWPLSSVTDLTAPVEIIKGLGFFYKQKFIYGDKAYSLYQIENGKIFDGQSDPRVHFILNCGSGSCPVLRPQLPTGDELEPFLAQAARDFVADPDNLKIAHDNKIIYLSAIFKWNRGDFIKASRDKTLMSYLHSIADKSIIFELEQAKNYTIEFVEYDWSVNKVGRQNEG